MFRTALDKTSNEYGPYLMRKQNVSDMNEARYMLELLKGDLINVAYSSSSVLKEKTLIPIKIPFSKGLLGYLIGLIPADRQSNDCR
jgi:hypothetical protein